jgi:hypothetical protein
VTSGGLGRTSPAPGDVPPCAHEGAAWPKTAIAGLIACLILLALSARGASFFSTHLQWTAEITSYGEESGNITELFLPLFAQYGFSASHKRPTLNDGQRFQSANSDLITMAPAVNCVVMRYYSYVYDYRGLPSFAEEENRALIRRAEGFRNEVLRLVAKLPEPRPIVTFREDSKSVSCIRSGTPP